MCACLHRHATCSRHRGLVVRRRRERGWPKIIMRRKHPASTCVSAWSRWRNDTIWVATAHGPGRPSRDWATTAEPDVRGREHNNAMWRPLAQIEKVDHQLRSSTLYHQPRSRNTMRHEGTGHRWTVRARRRTPLASSYNRVR